MATFTVNNDLADIPDPPSPQPPHNGDVTPIDEKTPFLEDDDDLKTPEIMKLAGKQGTFGTSTFKPKEQAANNNNGEQQSEIVLDDYDLTKNPFFGD